MYAPTNNHEKNSYRIIKDNDSRMVGLALQFIALDSFGLRETSGDESEYTDALSMCQGILQAVKTLEPDYDFYGKLVTPLRYAMQKERKVVKN